MLDTMLDQAMQRHAGGELAAAAETYRHILAASPNHPDALHLLGLANIQGGAAEDGAALVRRAMAVQPGCAPHHNSLALALRQMGRAAEAVEQYRLALALRPGAAELHCNLATTLLDLARKAEAVAQYREAAALAPERAEIWYNLANALADEPGEDAAACFARALALRPAYQEAAGNFGRWLISRARWAEAAVQLQAATRLAPGDAGAWNNLGIARQEAGQGAAAAECYRRAVALDGAFADAQYNLGCLLAGDGQVEQALACHRAAAATGFAPAMLGQCMAELPILVDSAEEAVARRARYDRALGRLVEAPRGPAESSALAAGIGRLLPFFLPYLGEDDRNLQARHGRFAHELLARALPPARLVAPPRPGQRIRLGIVSGHVRDHTLFRLFLQSWLTVLDRRRFELVLLHTGAEQDGCTAWAASRADRFVTGLPSPQAWRDAIEEIGPHALLYPEIGMDPVCFWLAAQRLAPLQCVAWGHPETTGLPTIDAFLSSADMEPDGAERFYTERLVRLPHLGMHYVAEPLPALKLERASLGLPEQEPLFWSGQALMKYNPAHDVLFARIAAELGACRFIFIGFAKSRRVTEQFRARLSRVFAEAGLDSERHCVWLEPMDQAHFIAAAGLADVVLDTPGWSGGKSTLDLLVHDPAIVTWPGRFLRGRHSAAILRRIGCTATIAGSAEEYVHLAVRLAREPGWRAEIRAAMAAGKSRVLADAAPIRALEDFLAGQLRHQHGVPMASSAALTL